MRPPLRYAAWTARDVAMGPGAIMLAMALLITFVLTRVEGGGDGAAASLALLRGIAGVAMVPLVLAATAGIVSGDLSHGYYRSLFAKPVDPRGYYLQRWVIGGVAVLLFLPLMALGVAARTGTIALGWSLVGQSALLYLLLGGLIFLLSTVTRRDWLLALAIFILHFFLHGLLAGGAPLGWFAHTLVAVLPPFHLVDLDLAMPRGGALMHVLLYGAGLVAAALAVLRWRAMGVGGRA